MTDIEGAPTAFLARMFGGLRNDVDALGESTQKQKEMRRMIEAALADDDGPQASAPREWDRASEASVHTETTMATTRDALGSRTRSASQETPTHKRDKPHAKPEDLKGLLERMEPLACGPAGALSEDESSAAEPEATPEPAAEAPSPAPSPSPAPARPTPRASPLSQLPGSTRLTYFLPDALGQRGRSGGCYLSVDRQRLRAPDTRSAASATDYSAYSPTSLSANA